jgi:tricorn protease
MNAASLILTTLLAGGISNGMGEIQLQSTATITPDSKTLVFAWAGDIWTSSLQGGEASRLTYHPAPDDTPKVSRDGKFVFFNSARTGSEQVFRIPIQGGTPEQITFHSEGSSLEDLHPTKPAILVRGYRDHAGRRPYRLIEKNLNRNKDEEIIFDANARYGRYSPDGKKLLIVRDGAPTYRKGYEGAQASRIWLYDFAKKTFTESVKDKTGCRYPIWAPDGKSFYYVTSRSGAHNIWHHQFDEEPDRQITQYPDDSVFAPAISANGKTIIYRHLFDLHQISTQGKANPEKINLYHRTTLEHPKSEALTFRSTRDATVTPTGLEWAFEAGGEIWAMDTVLKEPNQLTHSPALESDVYFAKNGKYIYYKKDNGVIVNYWRMSKTNSKEFWWNAESFNNESITKGPKQKSGFSLSPNEELIAYVEYPGTLYLAKPDGSETRKLIEGWDSPSYVWSPDGKHIAYAVEDYNYNSDIYIIATDGKSEPVNVSRHPDSDYSPVWSPDGKILAFAGRRHSTQTDLFFVHLRRETHFRSDRDAKIESARRAMSKDPQYKEEKKNDSKETEKKEAPKEESNKEEEDPIDFEDLHKRIQRIPLNGMSLSRLHWMPDSKNLTFQSGGSIHRVEAKSGAKPAAMAKASGPIIRYHDNDKIYLVANGVPAFFTKGSLSSYSFTIPMDRDRAQYQRMGFKLAWRVLRDRFYDESLNNRDWNKIRTKYELAAANAPTANEYARVMALLLGELNASHMGFYPNDFPKQWKFNEAWRSYTPHLGVRLDKKNQVTFVHPNGPADRPGSRIHVGDRILKVHDQAIRSDVSLTRTLNGPLDRDIHLSVKGENDEAPREVIIRPISYSQARALAQSAHLDERNDRVKNASKNKLGYLHVARMMWDEFEKFEHHIYERGAGKNGLIIDVRDNGGGFTCDHLLTVLTQPLHAYTVGRNGAIGYPQDRHVYASWNKPIVVICNQNSFSNAEIFSHAIKTVNRGKIVGIPTAGGVISTGSATILELGRMRLPGRGWFLPHNGEDMELYGAVPHFIVDVTPGDLSSGKDPQLEKAIEVLKKEVKERSLKLAPPVYRSNR